jgi:hypothetical protein
MRRYRENLEFYEGKQWGSARRPRDRRLTFNYARTVVEKTAAYTMVGKEIVVDPEDGSDLAIARARRTEQVLRDVSEDNGLDLLDFDNEVDCSVLGDAACKVTWDADRGRIRITAPDVQGLYTWTLPDDMQEPWRVASRYTVADTDGAADAVTRGKGEREVVEVWTADTLEVWVNDELQESRENPYGFIPFVIYPNVRQPKRSWGVSDLEALKEPLRELNRALSQLSVILELSGNPIAVLENVTEASDIAVQPGAVWEIPEKARAYLLDLLQGGGVGLHVDYTNLVLRTLHDLAEVPRSAFGETRQALSGVALEMELDPLLKKVERKRLIRGEAFRQRADMVLQLLERFTGAEFGGRVRPAWGPVLPQDRSRLVQDEVRLVNAGVHSRRTAAGLLDVADPDGEWQRWLAEESDGREKGG